MSTNQHPSIVQEISETILAIDENKSSVVVEKEKKTHDGLVLKELLENLHYAFLGVNGTKPTIISIALNEDMETKLLEALKKNMESFSWLIEDIKGISPSVCMHNILMENEYMPIVEHQRQLNPTMKEFVKKEVFKWLHVGFIYAISNNSWVSLVQVAPKKGGMTVMRNDKNKLILTSTITRWCVCIDNRKLNKAQGRIISPCPS